MTGEELRDARERKSLTQQQVAERLGVTQAYFSMLENGRRVLPARLARRAVTVLRPRLLCCRCAWNHWKSRLIATRCAMNLQLSGIRDLLIWEARRGAIRRKCWRTL